MGKVRVDRVEPFSAGSLVDWVSGFQTSSGATCSGRAVGAERGRPSDGDLLPVGGELVGRGGDREGVPARFLYPPGLFLPLHATMTEAGGSSVVVRNSLSITILTS